MSDETDFHVFKGGVLHSAQDLLAALPAMTQEQFTHHVTSYKNDFALWVADGLQNRPLAQLLRRGSTKDEFLKILDEQLKNPAVMSVSDEDFTTFKQELTAKNEEIGDRFERITKSLEDAMLNPYPPELTQREEQLKARYEELRAKISEQRKLGKDLFIASLMLRPFAAKMTIAHSERSKEGFEQVRILLEQVAAEIADAAAAPIVDFKRDVMALVEQSKQETTRNTYKQA